MTVFVADLGLNNVVNASLAVLESGSGRILFSGNNNSLTIGDGTVLGDCDVQVGADCNIQIGQKCYFHSLFVFAVNRATCAIMDEVSFNSRVRLLAHEPGQIRIGARSLFANDIDVSISDMHSIFDATTGERINPARDVEVGADVWIGQRSMVLKGAAIGEGSVIGAGSVISGEIEARSLAAGVPARILRRGIAWDRRLMDRMEEKPHVHSGQP